MQWKRLNGFAVLLVVLIVLGGCKKKESPVEPQEEPAALINPADANQLSGVVVIPGASTQQGNPPPPSNTTDAPLVSGGLSGQLGSNGSTVQLPFNYQTPSNLAGFYVQIVGASRYWIVPYSGQSGASGRAIIPLTLPTNLDQGTFRVAYCVYSLTGRVSNIITTTVQVLRLGTGALQISLTWDTATDIDLWVTDPTGTKIYYMNRSSPSGGQLDRDDVDGYGPENVYWLQNAPDGYYKVEVNYYSGTAVTRYTVTVNAPGNSRIFNGTLNTRGQTHLVTCFTKQGNNYAYCN
ncbi:MAG TPA: hypothetical protein VNL36_11055 [Bacteroidota bacterium]|nr:hypothetical protein [Bacteroidota bacterium]